MELHKSAASETISAEIVLICGAPQMPPARFLPGTLYFNLRVQRPARNDQWLRRTADHSVPPRACAAARVRRSPRWSGGHYAE